MFGSEGSAIVQYVVIFAVIFTALAAIVFTVRRLTGRSLALPGRANSRGRQPRLGIVDVYELDRARQLILLRRDNVEHLLLVGGPNDVVVERNIQRTQRPLPEAALLPEGASDPLVEPPADPLAQGGRLPEPPRVLPEIPGRRAEPLFKPGFEMPVVVPPPVPRSDDAPPVTFRLDLARLAGDELAQEVSAPSVSASSGSVPVPQAPAAEPAPAARAAAAPRRILSRTAAPLVEPRPDPASEPRPEPKPEPKPEAGSMRPEAAPKAPSLTVTSERRSVDPAVLSDMARQLQAALSRPSSAVTPAPAPPAASEEVDPVAAAMASAPPPPSTPPAMPAPPVSPAPVPRAAPETPRPSAPASPAPPPPVPQPTLPKVAPPFQAAVAAPRPDPKSAGNPFSVEEIEAEFARLLGRPLDKRG
ncbi:hypothetical protein [Methylobacterium sp. NEAU K]|uniref:hypothetical protein n=1 Tax=Methylobacterium sp. NEAU K TaxID=3064946 RepID=UPI002737111E|nr:hypothetical protein [Methylobacterium sp. NEAU K]MDP4003497.1 hypothetical protein [Methylobacterium sp. NEAU K]